MLSVVLSCALTAMVLSGLVSLSTRLIDQTRAQIVADASALAAIYGGESAAASIALHNDAELVSIVASRSTTQTVLVRIGRQYATSTARDRWVDRLPTMKP